MDMVMDSEHGASDIPRKHKYVQTMQLNLKPKNRIKTSL